MKVSYRWLRELAPALPPYAPEVAEGLAMLGFPVESVTVLSEGLGDLVVGHVLSVRPHPNADRLRVCQVDGGAGELQVVCGAPNVVAGGWYPFAPIGATLPGGLRIGEAKLRGERSQGMLCSEKELGLGSGQEGLMVLGGPLEPGRSLVEVLGLDDVRLDVEVTSNRPDLLSHLGIAREIGPEGDAGLELPGFPGESAKVRKVIEALDLATDAEEATGGGGAVGDDEPSGRSGPGRSRRAGPGIRVRIEAPDLCPRYLGLVVRGVRVGPSPAWLQARLRAAGSRPINNVVDATNYVLLELGQPLHAFDLDRLGGSTIVVRRARKGEAIETLDRVKRSLSPEMLAICDLERPVAVAGVMGGASSEVGAGTTDVLLECALFRPASIRSTRKTLGLTTDASYRFERGVDPEGMERALRRAARLIVATAGGVAEGPVADCAPHSFRRTRVRLRVERAVRLLGVPLAAKEIRTLLEPLGFAVRAAPKEAAGRGTSTRASGSRGGAALDVEVPGFRSYDVGREVDLIEEVARVRGFEGFSDDLRPFRPSSVPDHPLFALEGRLRSELVAWGLLEAQTPAFAPQGEGEVEILNPVSAEERFLRARLLPGLLRRLEYNAARGNRDVRLFEIGTAFAKGSGDASSGLPVETTRVALLLHGGRHPAHWSGGGQGVDAWDLKAVLGRIAEVVGGGGWTVAASEAGAGGGSATPGTSGRRTDGLLGGLLDGPVLRLLDADRRLVGEGGAVRRGAALDLPPWGGTVWAAEVVLPSVPAAPSATVYEPIPLHPGVDRDLALLVPAGVSVDRVLSQARGRGGEHLVEVGVFDVYRDERIGAGRRAIAIRLRFRARDRTLTDGEVDQAIGQIVRSLQEELGVGIRGQAG